MKTLFAIGRLADDAKKVESSKVPGGDPFISFTLCVNEKTKDTETTDYIKVNYPLTGVFEHLKKGKTVAVTGKPKFSTYTSPENGEAKISISMRATAIELL